MSQPRIKEHGERSTYTCMLWNLKSGRPTVVTVTDELPDRWVGRRCVVTMTSFDGPLEPFLKSDWRRGEAPPREEPRESPTTADAGKRPAGFHGFHP